MYIILAFNLGQDGERSFLNFVKISDTETRLKLPSIKKACNMNRLGCGGMERALLGAIREAVRETSKLSWQHLD